MSLRLRWRTLIEWRHLNGVYTQGCNRLKKTDGPLFRGQYKSILVDESACLPQVGRYIHRNPAEIKGAKEDALERYKSSSFRVYIRRVSSPQWLYTEKMYRMSGVKDQAARYKLFVLDGLDERIREFYVNNCVTGIFGDRAYRESI